MTLRNQSKALGLRLDAIPQEIIAAIRPALIAGGDEIAGNMRALAQASRDTGDLIGTIAVTAPGATTPAFASGGGKRTANENEVLITVGSPEVRYGHLVEFGSVKAEAQPFMLPGFRLSRTRVLARISRAVGKAIKGMGRQNA